MNAGNLIDNRYLIQRFLGQGGFGRTYLACDTQRFSETCVLKEFVYPNTGKEIIQKSRELFEREARILYNIDHPQIPKFIAWFIDKERLFIVQEYIEGTTYSQVLQERLSQTGKAFSEPEVIQWLWDMLPVLEYIHRHNLIHRDISLENVMLRVVQSKPVLIDFGLAKEKISQMWALSNNKQALRGTAVGKVGYAPLEQIRGGVCYCCSDIYALAVCAVVLLTGKTPDLLLDQNFDWQWHSYVKISDNLTRIIDKMLAERPTQRYQSASEVLHELELPNFPEEITAIHSIKKIEINIDEAKREHQVAEIVESDEFKLLEQRVKNLKNKTETSTKSTIKVQESEEKAVSQKLPSSHTYSGETSLQTTVSKPLNPDFIHYCQQELNNVVGPFANFMVKDILAEYPNIKRQEFIEALAAGISDPKRAEKFKQSIEIAQKHQSAKHNKRQTQGTAAASNTEFIEHCRQELLLCLGPVANFVLDDILAESPGVTIEQLVAALIVAINDPKQVENFKKRLQVPKS